MKIRGFKDTQGFRRRGVTYAEAYCDYIKREMNKLEGLRAADIWAADRYRDLLSCFDERLWFNFAGTTDLVIEMDRDSNRIPSEAPQDMSQRRMPDRRLSGRTRAVIQVKKDLSKINDLQHYFNQSIAELLCADVQIGVGMIFAALTDVTSIWHFLWIGKDGIQIESYRNTEEAMHFMREVP